MNTWKMLHPKFTLDMLGLVPSIISSHRAGTVAEQIDSGYPHGGGFSPMIGFKFDPVTHVLKYPGDTPMKPLAETQIGRETVYAYNYAIFAIVQPDGAFQVCRMD